MSQSRSGREGPRCYGHLIAAGAAFAALPALAANSGTTGGDAATRGAAARHHV